MIMADDSRPSIPLGPDRREVRRRINFEVARGVGSDIASGRGRGYLPGVTEHQAAHFAIGFGRGMGQHRHQGRS